jgi:tRNA A37 threonylcarbamoyladenosine biosynthesis protein TsaE
MNKEDEIKKAIESIANSLTRPRSSIMAAYSESLDEYKHYDWYKQLSEQTVLYWNTFSPLARIIFIEIAERLDFLQTESIYKT